MKINTDVTEIIRGRFRQTSIIPSPRPVAGEGQRIVSLQGNTAARIAGHLSREKSLGDALAIAQTARSLIQKAMVLSSQLRNIAAEAMVTGKTDYRELNTTMSEIRGSLMASEAGGDIAVINPVIAGGGQASRKIPLPSKELLDLNRIGSEMERGIPVRGDVLKPLEAALERKRESADKVLASLIEPAQEMIGLYSREGGNINAGTTLRNLVNEIPARDASAIRVQGNILHERARHLIS